MLAWALGLLAALTLGLISACLGYLYLLALAGWRAPRLQPLNQNRLRFGILLPAHNEAATIARTVGLLRALDYPASLFEIFVVADNCEDATASIATQAGATVLERSDAGRRGKGYALAHGFEKILVHQPRVDAVVVFDADTVVEPDFLRLMEAGLAQGHPVLQGNHIIANPAASWVSAIMYIAFLMDNRLRNLGRSNLGLSSKLMGDAMCFKREILEAHPWQTESQTEDAEYRAQLAQAGVRVAFVSQAKVFGEMVTNLGSAGGQRARWMRGRAEVTRRWAARLLRAGLLRGSWLMVDGGLELILPSFSTLAALAVVPSLLLILGGGANAWPWLWLLLVWVGLAAYPVLALILGQAPARAYFYLLLVPFYAIWRTWLRLAVRFQRGATPWIRTARSTEAPTLRD